MDVQNFISKAEIAVNALNKVLFDPANKFNKDQISKISPIACEILNAISSMSSAVASKTASLEGELRAYKDIRANSSQNNFGICEAISEMNEQQVRSKNIIICNVPESVKTTEAGKILDDQAAVTTIIGEIDKSANENITKIYRIGKSSNTKPRPIKIELQNAVQSRNIISKRSLLKNNIRIYPDQTPAQQKFLNDLRSQLEKRKENGEDVTIKYINSTPRIVPNLPKN